MRSKKAKMSSTSSWGEPWQFYSKSNRDLIDCVSVHRDALAGTKASLYPGKELSLATSVNLASNLQTSSESNTNQDVGSRPLDARHNSFYINIP